MTLIGPYGGLHEVRSPQAPLPVDISRASSSTELLSGRSVSQRAPLSTREWKWNLSAVDVNGLRRLIGLEQGIYGPPPWRWYDPTAAQLNMLDDVTAACGMGEDVWKHLAESAGAVIPSGPITLGAGHTLAYSIEPTDMLAVPHRGGLPDPVPVIAGRTYTVSGYIADGNGYLGLTWCDEDRVEISTVLSAHTTGRAVVTAVAPEGAHGALVAIQLGDPVQVLNFDGTAGTYASTPDNAALDITGDIDMRAEVIVDSWTQTGEPRVIAKYGVTGDQCSYQARLLTNGKLHIGWSSNGSATGAPGRTSTVPIAAPVGQVLGLRWVLDVDNGSSGHTATFFTSTDWTTWNPLGDPVVTTGTTNIFASTTPVSIGARTTPEDNYFTGRVLRAEIRNGINGTAVANPDFRDPGDGWVPGDDSGTLARSDAAGRAWTLNGASLVEQIIEAQSGRRIGGLQLTETTVAIDWHPGMGIPRVLIAGANAGHRLLAGDTILRDFDVTLTEVA